MFDPGTLGNFGPCHVQEFWGADEAPTQIWRKPPGVQFFFAFLLSPGGAGGGGALNDVNSVSGGGGSGGAGCVIRLFGAAANVPDVLALQIGRGGFGGLGRVGSFGNGDPGEASFPTVVCAPTLGNATLLSLPAGGSAGGGTTAAGGSAGSGASASTSAFRWTDFFLVQTIDGVTGKAGGINASENLNGSTSSSQWGGTATPGGGVSAANAGQGGGFFVNGAYNHPSNTGGSADSSTVIDGRNGPLWRDPGPWDPYPGSGGGSKDNTAGKAGKGGNAAIGNGGGGGGGGQGGTDREGGDGGHGGNGFALVVAW